jgi:hypothetical protein
MFSNTQGKGFQITFANGFGVSVQWGPGNYCGNRDGSFTKWLTTPAGESCVESTTAEVAILTPAGALAYVPAWSDQVRGYCTPAEVLALMNEVAGFPADKVLPVSFPTLEEEDT